MVDLVSLWLWPGLVLLDAALSESLPLAARWPVDVILVLAALLGQFVMGDRKLSSLVLPLLLIAISEATVMMAAAIR